MASQRTSGKGSTSNEPYPIYMLGIAFAIAIGLLGVIFYNFPTMPPEHASKIKFPREVQHIKDMGTVLSLYTDNYYFTVLSGYCATYIFLQTFSIPGSIFLSFLAGALFGLPIGFLLVCTLATIGATNCYLLAYYLGRNLVKKFFPDKLELFGAEVAKHRANLLNYILFLRFTPVIPNWFVNIASPIFNIPVQTFMIGTFFGVMPQTFVAVKAGLTLQEIRSPSDILDVKLISTLFLLALLSLVPTLEPVRVRLDKLLNKNNPSHTSKTE